MEHDAAILPHKESPEQNCSHLRCGCLYLKHLFILPMQVSIKNFLEQYRYYNFSFDIQC